MMRGISRLWAGAAGLVPILMLPALQATAPPALAADTPSPDSAAVTTTAAPAAAPADSAASTPAIERAPASKTRSGTHGDDSITWGRRRDRSLHDVQLPSSYQRVDGFYFGLRHTFTDPERPLPRLTTEAGYAFSRERWLYRFEIEQPLFPRERVVVGGGLYRLTRSFSFDDEIVGGTENTLAALLVKEDYRDYFEGEGGRLFATLHATGKYALSGEYRAEAERALRPAVGWALLDGPGFRPNPAADGGTLRAMTATLSHDSRPKELPEGTPFMQEMRRANRDWVRLSYETAGRDLGGDFDYALARLDARGWWKLSPEQFLSARLLAGRNLRGRQPVQSEFYAGGISTLRAHPYKEFRGDRLLLLNTEYAVDVLRATQALVFADIGRAWVDAEHPGGPRLPIDVGFGVQTRDERLRILVAKDARDASSPLVLTVRTQASF